ncbi:gamma-butyrobetaine dioxygenase-like [Patiria miniata]|uniref:Gamma-butyrobetaine dioxygenase n=1 Tax=Patiria miniata TaxID=46514 RepID=A0A914BNZ7_PATMI|nr:gamma-butyrobetaine dioxygenase-like [Patiria miniata]
MEPSPRLTSITRDDSAGWYRVRVDSGDEGKYPYVWLRDNCRCSECFYPSATQRLMKMTDLDPDVIPLSETIVDDGQVLRVTWPDQHRSDFQAAWLSRRHFSDSSRDVVTDPELQSWGAELNDNIPTFDFQKVREDDMELFNWLDALNTKGLALVKGAPTKKGTIRQLAERVAYLKKTCWGEEFQVVSQQNASDLAYTGKPLGFHVDQAYLSYYPGIQMLHCIQRTVDVEGGENQFVDGLHVAQQIQKEFPEAYQILTTLDVDVLCATFEDHRSVRLKCKSPTINVHSNGRFRSINYSDGSRAPYQTGVAVEQVISLYRALKLFSNVMYRQENVVRHQLAEGEIATFNNTRVLHARSAFTIAGDGGRHLEGGYMDWDEARSRIRVLREKLFGDAAL